MRGDDQRTGNLFAYVNIEERIRPNHPLRPVKALVDEVLGNLSQDFDRLYGTRGRPSIPPEMLLRAMVLQAVYSIRSERQLMERMEFDLLLRWFVGLGMDDPVWNHSTFSKNRDRLLDGDIAARFLSEVLACLSRQALPQVKRLLSNEHFSVDGTLIDAWASMKSFKEHAVSDDTDTTDGDGDHSGGRNSYVDFRGKRRSNQTHASTTDPDARLYRKGPGHAARLCYLGHGLMENRSGLIVDTRFTPMSGRAERQAARHLPAAGRPELPDQSTHPQTDRRALWLDESGWTDGPSQVARTCKDGLSAQAGPAVHLQRSGQQLGPAARFVGGAVMSGPVTGTAVVSWRITGADGWTVAQRQSARMDGKTVMHGPYPPSRQMLQQPVKRISLFFIAYFFLVQIFRLVFQLVQPIPKLHTPLQQAVQLFSVALCNHPRWSTISTDQSWSQ